MTFTGHLTDEAPTFEQLCLHFCLTSLSADVLTYGDRFHWDPRYGREDSPP